MLITFLTDFGTQDAYVAQMKGQILSICPGANLLDVTHQIAPQDITAGAICLSQSAPYFPEHTIHIAVVDPGVGTDRKLLAVEAMMAAEGGPPHVQRFVLPDNGLVDFCLQQAQEWSANYLTNSAFWRAGVSSTFHGRDIMGPVAAHWALGKKRAEFGASCPQPQRLNWPQPKLAEDQVEVAVIAIDHFGNVITNLKREQSSLLRGSIVKIEFAGQHQRIPVVQTYGQVEPGTPLLLVGSHGFVELAIAGGHAARHFGLAKGESFRIVR